RNRHGAVAAAYIFGDPQFLARDAHGDQQYVGPKRLDLPEYPGFFAGRKETVMDEDKAVLRRQRGQPLRGSFRIAPLGAEQRHRQRLRFGAKERGHEVGPVEVGGEGSSIKQLGGYVDADPVRQDQEVVERGREISVAESDIGVVGVQERHFREAAFGKQPPQEQDALVPLQGGNRGAEDIPAVTEVERRGMGVDVHAARLSPGRPKRSKPRRIAASSAWRWER